VVVTLSSIITTDGNTLDTAATKSMDEDKPPDIVNVVVVVTKPEAVTVVVTGLPFVVIVEVEVTVNGAWVQAAITKLADNIDART